MATPIMRRPCRGRRNRRLAKKCSRVLLHALPPVTWKIALSMKISRSFGQRRYLLLPLPSEFGGAGMTLAQVCREQRRLAYHAPATALAVNMHLYWLALPPIFGADGDTSLEWILREAAAGEIFAAGHAESGNDIPVLLSTTKAERVEGGYRFTGHKHFGSLTPVWTRFGLHGMDTSNPDQPKIVHAFMPRDAPGYTIKKTWDVLGMRATRSDDTVLLNNDLFQTAISPG